MYKVYTVIAKLYLKKKSSSNLKSLQQAMILYMMSSFHSLESANDFYDFIIVIG